MPLPSSIMQSVFVMMILTAGHFVHWHSISSAAPMDHLSLLSRPFRLTRQIQRQILVWERSSWILTGMKRHWRHSKGYWIRNQIALLFFCTTARLWKRLVATQRRSPHISGCRRSVRRIRLLFCDLPPSSSDLNGTGKPSLHLMRSLKPESPIPVSC